MAFTLGVVFTTEAVELNAIEALCVPRGLAPTKENARAVLKNFINRERRTLQLRALEEEQRTKEAALPPIEGVS